MNGPGSAKAGRVSVRDVSLFVEAMGAGDPVVLLHGGPGADHWTLHAFGALADRFRLVFYDHRCNGRSEGAPLESFTWDNLVADADALRAALGYERWAVLGHSFGGHVALEYALRHPDRVSRLVLLSTGADAHWAREEAPRTLARRGYDPAKVELVRRWFAGDIEPRRMLPILLRIGDAYDYRPSMRRMLRSLLAGGWRSRMRGDIFVHASRHLLPGWSVRERLGQIAVPTLVIAGAADFIFPPECQVELASGISSARLHLVEHAGHNPHEEQPAETLEVIAGFLAADAAASARRPAAA
jgi:proline iminopeptidase